jgi:hypothetical protein
MIDRNMRMLASSGNRSTRSSTTSTSSSTRQQQLICKAHSAALVHEDNEERNPIEYALLDDAPGDMISTLQRTSVQFQRARRAELKAKTLCNIHHAIAGTQKGAMNVQ